MGKNHIKRLAAPRTWPIERKVHVWISKQMSGPHDIESSVPLVLILKEFLNYAKTSKEAKQILNTGKVKVDGIVRKECKFSVGLLDVLSVDKEDYRLLLNRNGKIILHPINGEEVKIKLRKIVRKQKTKKNKTQITSFDGFNKNIDKEEYSIADTLIFDITKNEIKGHLKFEKGVIIYITKGKQVGVVGILKEIKKKEGLQPIKIIFNVGKKNFETLKDYAFVIGKTKQMISIPQNERNEKN